MRPQSLGAGGSLAGRIGSGRSRGSPGSSFLTAPGGGSWILGGEGSEGHDEPGDYCDNCMYEYYADYG